MYHLDSHGHPYAVWPGEVYCLYPNMQEWKDFSIETHTKYVQDIQNIISDIGDELRDIKVEPVIGKRGKAVRHQVFIDGIETASEVPFTDDQI